MSKWKAEYKALSGRLEDEGIDVRKVKAGLKKQRIETPSWGYGDGGTRFKVFHVPGSARTIHEKLEDAALVNRLTGIAPSVAVHIPWDYVDDFKALSKFAARLGLRIGAVNPNMFQEPEYLLGSMCSPDAKARRKAVRHMFECVSIMRETGSDILSLWFGDGTNYAGQDSFRERKHRMEQALARVYAALPAKARMLIEYKCFEPAFYQTDISDWGIAHVLAQKLGPKAQVLVDLGHHLPGANIEHIVAVLLDEAMLGGFHFNNRKYADDDLMVGSINPFELFLIYCEIADAASGNSGKAAKCAKNIAFMIDQSHNIEPKIEAVLMSVMNCQAAYAKSLLVNRAGLAEARAGGDVLGAHRALTTAYETDVRPLLAAVREEMGLAPDPLAAFKKSGYMAKAVKARG